MAKSVKTPELNIEGLDNNTMLSASAINAKSEQPQFNDVEWLKANNPADYHSESEVSPRYNEDTEKEVLEGIKTLEKLQELGGIEMNPLMMLLGKWWEVKSARAAIRQMLADEATSKGFEKDVYLEIEIGEKQVDVLKNLSSAIGRMSYARTFFKPRKGLSNKVHYTPIKVDGVLFNVPTQALISAKEEFAGNKTKLKEYILANGIKQELDIEEL